ncbi:MAG: hypothetical protein AAF734_06655, partial [Bacteroidota bacterium]
MKTYWRLLSYTKPVTQFALPFFFTSFLASLFGILNIALLIPTLNVLFEITPTEVPSELREYTRDGIEGSNPFLSAIFSR